MTELQALQNFGERLNLNIKEHFTQDKRKTIKKYLATMDGVSVSPALEYEHLNHFLLGWSRCEKMLLQTTS